MPKCPKCAKEVYFGKNGSACYFSLPVCFVLPTKLYAFPDFLREERNRKLLTEKLQADMLN